MAEKDTIVQIGTGPVATSDSKKPCLTFLQGTLLGLVYTLGAETIIGRGDEADLSLDDPRVSRKHARIRVSASGNVTIEDYGSRNGTFVNGIEVHEYELRDGDRVQIGYNIMKFSYQDELEYQLQHEIASGIKDPLTGLHTKKYFDGRADTEFRYVRRHGKYLGVLALAVDHFHKTCFSHGQAAADVVLKEVGQAVNEVLRAGDILARFEGEHFAVLARDLDDKGSVILAQRIHKAVRDHAFVLDGMPIRLTVSIGIATLTEKPNNAAGLIELAERALRKIRERGGENTTSGAAVIVHPDSDDIDASG
jgi:two-component system cell cycle response regulator